MCISNIISAPVIGENFYGRKKELKWADKLLDSGNNLLISAPRRIGKSSFVHRLSEKKAEEGWKCVFVDLEKVKTEEEFLITLLLSLRKSGVWHDVSSTISHIVEKLEAKVDTGVFELGVTIKPLMSNIYHDFDNLLDHSEKTLIVIDELSLFLSRLAADGDVTRMEWILNWLRGQRQYPSSKVRWVFCGSIGLHNFTSLYNLSFSINDLAIFSLDTMTDEEAYGLLSGLAESENMILLDDQVVYALKKLSWNIPYLIQVLFSRLSLLCLDGEAISNKDIDCAYNYLFNSEHIKPWVERLKEYGEREEMAIAILNIVCQKKEGYTRKEIIESVSHLYASQSNLKENFELSLTIMMLESDAYIVTDDKGRRMFKSEFFRKYWQMNIA